MLPTVHIRQDALQKWCGNPPKIDVTDALLIALIRSLNPDNPKVAEIMWNGCFRLSRAYVREMLPLINLADDWISRKLRHLQKVGLVDVYMRATGKGKQRYARLSRLYWQEEERANKRADSHKDYTPMGVHSTGSTDPNHDGCTPIDQLKDHKEIDPPAALADDPTEGPPPVGLPAEQELTERDLSQAPVLREMAVKMRRGKV